jgi:autoinducer 2-degrading protein
MLALVVSLKVKPDKRTQFLEAAEDDSTCSVRDEPGCLRFDVVQDEADPNHFFFYEVYRDEAALEAHRQTPHYPRWRRAAETCLAEPSQVTRAATVLPRAYR